MSDELLILVDHDRNRELLVQELRQDYQLADPPEENPLSGEFDLCLIDETMLRRFSDELSRARDNEKPVFLPALLLRRNEDSNSSLDLSGKYVDDAADVPISMSLLRTRIENLLEKRELSLKLRELNNSLQNRVDQKTRTIRDREETIVMQLVSASTYRDEETGGHIQRLGMYSEVMARELGWDDDRVDDVRLAATMHDIGKIGIPDDILLHPGDLTDEQFATMQEHTRIGADIIGDSEVDLLQMAERIALSHHKHWDGSGYPQGLSGEEIPVEGRLVALVDVYDALVHDRVYRDAMSESRALDIIKEDRGSHFDPRMHDCFFEVLPSLRVIRQLSPDEDPGTAGSEAETPDTLNANPAP